MPDSSGTNAAGCHPPALVGCEIRPKPVNNHLTISRTITPHPNSTCATQMFHTTESGLCWKVASVEKSYVDEVMRYL